MHNETAKAVASPYSQLPAASRCRRCQIGIVADATEAASLGLPFCPSVNLRVGDLCIGCAGGLPLDALIVIGENGTAVPPKKDGETMPRGIPNQKYRLFESVEVGVPAPPPPADKKYLELATKILEVPMNGNGRSEWMRFLFATRRAANGANTHLSKKARPAWREEGHDVETSLVPADDGDKCYLYVRRIRTISSSPPPAAASDEQAK